MIITVVNGVAEDCGSGFIRIKDIAGGCVQLCPDTVKNLKEYFRQEKDELQLWEPKRVVGAIKNGERVIRGKL
jgi:hypothetical protein